MDITELKKWFEAVIDDKQLFEIRILNSARKGDIYSGYFYSIDDAIPFLEKYDAIETMNFYYLGNPIKEACASRTQFNRIEKVSTATSAGDIEKRRWLYIDVDCVRPTGVASNNEEKKLAHDKAGQLFKFLKTEGWPEPIVNDSSSGYHLLIPADIPNVKAHDENEVKVKTFLSILSDKFSDDRVKIDSVLFDANRIMRLPGFYGRKGRNTEERPHRMAKVLHVPSFGPRVSVEMLDAFIEKYKPEEKKQNEYRNAYQTKENFDIESFMSKHGIEVHSKSNEADGVKYVLERCPFDPQHAAPDSAIFVKNNGAIGFKCFHDSCSQYTWRDLRLKFEPDAYEMKEYRPLIPSSYSQRRYASRPEYKFREYEPDTGKKWLFTKDIKKIDINTIEGIMTGFPRLDNAIKKLILGEVTILSGSNSSGKSSWLNCLVLNARQQGFKSAIWSGELQKEILVAWLHAAAASSYYMKKSKFNDGYYVPSEIEQMIDEWLLDYLFIYNNEYGNKWEQIFKDMEEVVDNGAQLLILDNLFSLDIDLFDGDKNNKQKELTLQICQFAKKKKVHIILVAHPRKSVSFLRKEDIAGTSDITNAADNVFIVHRVNNDFKRRAKEFFGEKMVMEEFEPYGNVLEVCKCRMFGAAVDTVCGMHYDIVSRQFTNEAGIPIHYGWEQLAPQQQKIYNANEETKTNINDTEETRQNSDFWGSGIEYKDDNSDRYGFPY